MSKNVLSVENVTMQFGGVVAVDNLNLEVNEGEIVALIGPNGAGKTTAFNVITGVYAPTNGRVRFNEACIVRNHPSGKMKKQYKGEHADMYTAQFAPEEALDDEALKAWKEGQKALDAYAFTDHVLAPTPDKITALGMARTFQNIRLWKTQTVFDNVLIAKHMRRTSNLFTAAFHLNAKEEMQQRAEVLELLKVVGLEDVQNELATSLPYGKQRRLEIARALATDPTLLLLDEPAAGTAGDAGAGGVHQGDPGSLPQDDPADRAPHGPGHGHCRPDLRVGFRQADRQGHTGGDTEQRARHRRILGGGRRC